jgi:putative transposase
MQLRYNYRLYPTPGQRVALARAFGCARVVFNDGLRMREEAQAAGRPYVTDAELSARLTAAKATLERAWLGEVSAVVLQQALADLNAAYRNFFASLAGRRKGPKVAPPRFRSRKDRRQAIRFTHNARWQITSGGKLRLPKIGDVPVRWSRDLPSAPSSVTVIKDPADRYFASFVVQTVPDPLPEAESVIGIDLGLTHFAVLSDGRKITSPRFLRRAEKKLRRAQCPGCGAWLDRDINAAVNVAQAAGLAVTACGAQVRPGVIVAQRGEAGTHPKPRWDAA